MNARGVSAAAVLVASALVLSGCGGADAPVATAPVATGTVASDPGSVAASSLVEPSYPSSAAPVAAPPASAGERAGQFVTILGHTAGVDRAAWTDQLTRLCSTSFGDTLALRTPSQIPDQEVTGPASLVGNNPLLVAAYFVPTTQGGFTVWVDYTTAPGVVTGALPGRHVLDEGPS